MATTTRATGNGRRQPQPPASRPEPVTDTGSVLGKAIPPAMLMNPAKLDPLNLAPTMVKLGAGWLGNAPAVITNLSNLWYEHAKLAQETLVGPVPGNGSATNGAGNGGTTFTDPAWHNCPVFSYVRRSYQLNSDYLQKLPETAGLTDLREQRKGQLVARLLAESLSPENYAITNPAVIRATRQEQGANLVRGLRNFIADVQQHGWPPKVTQVDHEAFEVGTSVATTPGKVVWRNHLFELIQYSPTTPRVQAVPFLFVPPWINKYYILDLKPKRSMVRWLVSKGYTVFLMSWVNPDESHAEESLETYLTDGVLTAIDRVREETEQPAVNVAGYCIGGTLMGKALAHLAEANDDRVQSCTFFASQFDFSDAGELMAFTDEHTVTNLAEQMYEQGFLRAGAMGGSFDILRSADLYWHFFVRHYLLGLDPPAFDLLFWNADSTRMPARLHDEYLRACYVHDLLAQGKMYLAGVHLNLANVTTPTYHVATREDHIAPATSVYRGMRKIGGQRTFVLAGSGHIAGVINPPEAHKYSYCVDGKKTGKTLEEWDSGATCHEGSWWPHWARWLGRRSGPKVAARQPGQQLGVLGDAPGSYVHVRHPD